MVSFVPLSCLESQVLPCCCGLERKSLGMNRNKVENWGRQQGTRAGGEEIMEIKDAWDILSSVGHRLSHPWFPRLSLPFVAALPKGFRG